MMTVLTFGIIIGLDNLQVASSIGLLPIKPYRKWLVALAFGFFEAIMPLLGLLGGHLLSAYFETWVEWFGPIVLIACGLSIIYFTLKEREEQLTSINNRWILLGLPFCLSFDNLFAGVGLGVLGFPVVTTAIVLGSISATMCFIGIFIGQKVRGWVHRSLPFQPEMLSGIWLLIIAIIMIFGS